MATNVFRKYPGFRNEEWVVPSGTVAGVVVQNGEDDRYGVTLTARGDVTESVELPNGLTVSDFPVGGVGNKPTAATVAVEGYDFLLDVTGVSEGETVAGNGTPQGTAVYADAQGGGVFTVTLSSGAGNDQIGVIADGRIIGTIAPVSIGVGL